MAAELLRRAATALREHAERAAAGPWNASPVDSPDGLVTSAVYSFAHPTGTTESEVVGAARKARGGGIRNAHNARYIALMHPPVALALADSLDAEAGWLDTEAVRSGSVPLTTPSATFALARAILREAPDA